MHHIFDCWPPAIPDQHFPRFSFDRDLHLPTEVIALLGSENGGAR